MVGSSARRPLELVSRVNVTAAGRPCTPLSRDGATCRRHRDGLAPRAMQSRDGVNRFPHSPAVTANILLARWDMPSVGDTISMLSCASTVDGNISKWDVSSERNRCGCYGYDRDTIQRPLVEVGRVRHPRQESHVLQR